MMTFGTAGRIEPVPGKRTNKPGVVRRPAMDPNSYGLDFPILYEILDIFVGTLHCKPDMIRTVVADP